MTSTFVTDGTLGTNVSETSTSAKFALGQRVTANEGAEWIYVQADAAGITGEGYAVLIDEAFAADMIDTTNSATGRGQMVGVAKTAFAANEFGFVQIAGVANIRVAANAAANARLNTTATAGQLDDDGTAGSEEIEGIVLTTANGGAAGTAEGVLTNARVGATL